MPRADLRVAVLRDAIEQWDRVLAGTSTPEPRSSLAADDSACLVLPCSHLAWSALDHGRRALGAAVALLDSSTEAPPDELIGHLRSALVHASHALTLMAPGRRERTQHGMRVAWTALSGMTDKSPGIAELAPFVSPIAAAEVARQLKQRDFQASPRWTDLTSVRIAGSLLSGHVSDPQLYADSARFLWSVTADDAPLRDDLVTSAESVRAALDRAVDLWATRCLAPAHA